MDEHDDPRCEVDHDTEMMREEIERLFPALGRSERAVLLRAWLLKSSITLVVNPRLQGLTDAQRIRHRELVQRVEKQFVAARQEVQHLIEATSLSADELEFIWGEILSIPFPDM